MIRDGFFSPESPNEFKDIVDMLLHHDRLAISRLQGDAVQKQLLVPVFEIFFIFLLQVLDPGRLHSLCDSPRHCQCHLH